MASRLPTARELRAEHWPALRLEASAPTPPPFDQGPAALVRYGFAQVFLGLRTLFRSHDLLGLALAPAIGVAIIGVIAGVSAAQQLGVWRGVLTGFVAVAALAPVPPLVFGRVYAHLASAARPHLGLTPAAPYLRGVSQLVGEWISQLIVLALAVAPLTVLLGLLPVAGAALALAVQGVWALHWIVVEGYDNARTLPPGRTIEECERESAARPGSPWFHRWLAAIHSPNVVVALLGPWRMLSEVVVALARPWRLEVDLAEERPWISLGFGLGVVAMLAVPGLNLLFRPAVVVGGVHLRHRLLEQRPSEHSSAPRGGTAPYPAVPPVEPS